MTADLDPMQERVRDMAEHLLAQMPDHLRAECDALADLDPTCAGMRLHHQPDGTVAFVWVGRHLGSVSADWLLHGDDTDGGA